MNWMKINENHELVYEMEHELFVPNADDQLKIDTGLHGNETEKIHALNQTRTKW